jgi:hypothetical protein
LDAAAQAPQCRTRDSFKSGEVGVPYVDINPHRSRPKWWGYVALGILLVVTVAVVVTALTHH